MNFSYSSFSAFGLIISAEKAQSFTNLVHQISLFLSIKLPNNLANINLNVIPKQKKSESAANLIRHTFIQCLIHRWIKLSDTWIYYKHNPPPNVSSPLYKLLLHCYGGNSLFCSFAQHLLVGIPWICSVNIHTHGALTLKCMKKRHLWCYLVLVIFIIRWGKQRGGVNESQEGEKGSEWVDYVHALGEFLINTKLFFD